MIRRHIERSTGREPLWFSELINNLKSHQPLQPLFNTIAWTLKPKAGMTSFGYVKVDSKFLADRIWSITSDWESLIKKENSPKAIALSMTVNRITGSKEVVNFLHKCGHGISYADIRHLNKSWANEVTINTNQILPSTLSSGKPIHIAIDNSDGKQQTITGCKTTHYTNGVAFQLNTSNATEIMSPQNIEKTECGVLLKDQKRYYSHRKLSRKFVLIHYQILLIASAVTI